ncbi:MAG: acyl-CoA dehydrogenase family protein [Alcanivoracaceae bacterium]
MRASVRGVLTRFARRAEEAENAARVPEESLRELEEIGIHRFLEPRDLGGYELPFGSFFSIISEIASACGSTAWTFMLFSVHAWGVQFAPASVRDMLYTNGSPGRLATVFRNAGTLRRDSVGYRLDGVWPFATGAHLADFIAVKATLVGEGDFHVYLRPDQIAVRSDWLALGLEATASHSIEADAVAISTAQVVSDTAMQKAFAERVAQASSHVAPVPAVVSLGTVAPILGMTRACVNAYEQTLRARASLSEVSAAASERLARMRTELKAMDLLYRESVTVLDARIPGRTLSDEAIVSLSMHASWIARGCRNLVNELLGACGTRTLSSPNAMRRHATGVMVLSTHYLVDYDAASTQYGGLLVRRN